MSALPPIADITVGPPKFVRRVGVSMPLANYVRDFEGIALPLRTNVRFTPSEGITQFVPSREARVYDSGVGPGLFLGVLLRFNSPTMACGKQNR